MKEKMTLMKERNLFSYILTWFLFVVVLWWKFYQEEVEIINTTSLAFTYEYGFISRGLMGTIFLFVDKILPGNQMTYEGVMNFTLVTTMLYFALLLWFFVICLTKCSKELSGKAKYMILFFTMFAVSMFITKYNFGRFDMYCLMLSILSAILIIYEKAEWLVVPFSALSVMIHQGNVFYLLNIILILLLYKAFSTNGKKRMKYIVLLGASFIASSVLFVYFEFFSRANGAEIYDTIVKVAEGLRFDGDIHEDIIDHEILGIELADRETVYRYKNFTEFPIFCLFMSPYLVMGFRFFKNLIKKSQTMLEKWKYFFVAMGVVTIVPAIILKCDFGRWMFMIIAYYFVVVLSLIAMKDKLVEEEISALYERVKKMGIAGLVLFIYPSFMLPFKDVVISQTSYNIADLINTYFLHLWK
ncbi:MAG: hypothetical protein IJ958_11510 [Agathobacter sp.]|nr:hypothetical protein [Agathobacter sp.]